jgi:hypothetical protein
MTYCVLSLIVFSSSPEIKTQNLLVKRAARDLTHLDSNSTYNELGPSFNLFHKRLAKRAEFKEYSFNSGFFLVSTLSIDQPILFL